MKIQLQLQGAKPYPYYSVLSDVEVLADIDELHKEFVLVPTEKDKNNITVVCKRFYISMIEKKILSNTFTKVNHSEDSIIDENKAFLLKHRIKFDQDNSKLHYCSQEKETGALLF